MNYIMSICLVCLNIAWFWSFEKKKKAGVIQVDQAVFLYSLPLPEEGVKSCLLGIYSTSFKGLLLNI